MPSGLSFTVNEYLRQYSTAIGNLWEGNIYHKSLDYLIRVLLRLHLAPARETRYKQMVNKRTKDKVNKEGVSVPGRRPLTRKLWAWKVKKLTDQLSEALQKRKSGDMVMIILKRLTELKKTEPAGQMEGQRQFRSLEEWLDQSGGSSAKSEMVGDEDDGDELDDEDTQETEEEEEVSNFMSI